MFALAPQRFPSDRSGDTDRCDSTATDDVSHNPHASCRCDLNAPAKEQKGSITEMISHDASEEHPRPLRVCVHACCQ